MQRLHTAHVWYCDTGNQWVFPRLEGGNVEVHNNALDYAITFSSIETDKEKGQLKSGLKNEVHNYF